MLASDHINMALQLIGALERAGVTGSPSEMTRGLQVFQNVVDTSNTSREAIFCEVENQFPTVNQQQTYSWGPGGTWNAPRPVRITQANFLMPTSPTTRRPMKIWTRKQWADISLQAIYTYPDGAYLIETFSWQANVAPAALTTAIAFPPGYAEYWLGALAIRLAPMHNKPVPQAVLDMFNRAQRGLGILSAAQACPRLQTDELQSGAGLYNWLSGQRNEN